LDNLARHFYSADSGGPSAEDMVEILGYREAAEDPAADDALEATAITAPWPDLISLRAYDFVVGWETGGKAFYQKVIKERPVWPEFASGITIGFGYDLGYHTATQFDADWGSRLPAATMTRLKAVIGFKTTEPGRSAKVKKAKQLVAALSDIGVPWDIALKQFDESKMPKLLRDLYGALDNLDRLHPHCRGALLSLVFNRGNGGFTKDGDRYAELRSIRALMTAGRPADIRKIPDELRSMQRIWGKTSSLAKRRREEADLFEAGLAESALVESLTVAGSGSEALEVMPEALVEDHEDVAESSLTDTDAPEAEDEGDGLEAVALSADQVKWNPNDDDQPDYRHLPKLAAGAAFELTPADLDTLLRFNDFEPLPGLMIFALRGAAIVGADQRIGVESLTLMDQRPDHRAFRCVIGVYDRARGCLSAFKASTVPNANAVVTCVQKAQSRSPLEGNILATGLYTYTVGTHRANTSHEIRGVLRLSKDATGASKVVVLRSTDDLIYDRRDLWDPCAPADNIHPGRRINGFSSLGCLTLPGDYVPATRKGTALWAAFRKALGLGDAAAAAENGRQFSTMLLTGLEAALAANLRNSDALDKPEATAALRRIRFGSKGDRVARLQTALGLAPDASRLVGPVTSATLIKRQRDTLGWADAILSPDMDRALGLNVF
jgi:GH24 family phage-related lysozyme (muramidase)